MIIIFLYFIVTRMLDISTLTLLCLYLLLVCQKKFKSPPLVWLKSNNSEDKLKVYYTIKCKNFVVI